MWYAVQLVMQAITIIMNTYFTENKKILVTTSSVMERLLMVQSIVSSYKWLTSHPQVYEIGLLFPQ